MSENETVPAASTEDSASFPKLDVTKLHALPSEQQDLYLLTFTSDLANSISSLTAEVLSANQRDLKKELFQIITLPSPPPTRLIRNNVGRCFADIFSKGDRKILFDTINELLPLLNVGKSDKDLKTRHAATHCLGEIFGAAGDSAIALSGVTCSSLLKAVKPSQNHTGFRGAIFKALGKLCARVGGSLDESVARDVWKQARNATSDKATLVQVNACRCLEQLVRATSYFDNSSDFDNLKSVVWKTIDSPAPAVRHAAATCLSAALVKNYSGNSSRESVPMIKKPKKVKRQSTMPTGDEETISRPGSPTPKKNAATLVFSLSELLRQLSTQYFKTTTSNRVRAGISVCYTRILKELGPQIVESQYMTIADHLLIEVLGNPGVYLNRYRLLMTRKFVRLILEHTIGRQLLGETGQLNAAKALLNDIIKNYPQVLKEKPEPSKYTLTGALSALDALIGCLGSATSAFAESCREGLLQVLQHPSYTVQVFASHCMRSFVLACPQQLIPCVTICMNSLNRELGLLSTPKHSPRRCVGFANGLSTVVSTAPLQPVYGSIEMNARVLSLATDLLKSSGNSELRVSGTQIQVAWILIGGLMALGPSFVKIHLSQLLLLWRNALPKPISKENMTQRTLLELSFLTHVRECALGSMLAFLQFNGRLLTPDVSNRLAAMLQHTTAFSNDLPEKKTVEDASQRLSPSLNLHDLDLMVRRRVLQCYTKLVALSSGGTADSLQHTNLLTLATSFFADPDKYSPSTISSSIASSAANFETIWDLGDNSGFGVTGLVRGLEISNLDGSQNTDTKHHWLTRDGIDGAIDQTLLSPICGSREHDSVSLYIESDPVDEFLPDPPATEVVNSAINLFALALPLQTPKVQESILDQILTFLGAGNLQRNPGRKAAVTVNIATALLATLKVSNREGPSNPGDLKNSAVGKVIQETLHALIINPDPYVRNIAVEALGRLCSTSGNPLTSNEINYLVETIVNNRDPNARAGCAVALGCVHSQVGSMAATSHLKNIHGILMSLSSDPHPTVHFWALEALSRVADSAALTFSGFASSTLGMIAQLYVADSHNDESASLATSNIELDWPTTAVLARCIESIINVLGPDLQDMSKPRDMILTLVQQFQLEPDALVIFESLRCLEDLSVYAPFHIDFAAYVRRLQTYLDSPEPDLRDAAVNGLYNLMKRDAEVVIQAAEPELEEKFWLVLDACPGHETTMKIIENWLEQTSILDAPGWIQRCQTVLTKTKGQTDEQQTAITAKATAVPDLQDEEVAGFATAAGGPKDDSPTGPDSGQELLRWQVRTFAMKCLSDLLATIGNEIATKGESSAELPLQQKVGDLIRMAFSASTANILELRLWGLRIIDQILKIFGKTPDPDFVEASLLEQYQAQISSALTPAFAADSSPELASEAVNVCAAFISTGIVTDVDRMGRILKLLVSALEDFSSEKQTTAIGDLKGLSSNAQVMVKVAVYSAWAELQVASAEQSYLNDVLKPHIATLPPLWLSSLREFARLRFEPDISMTLGTAISADLSDTYAAFSRETLLKFYQDAWLNFVDAIASLIEQDSDFVFSALDGKIEEPATNGTSKKGSDINYRDEPVAFFFVLFGIAFESLVNRGNSDSLSAKEQTLHVLSCLKKILHPSVSGQAIYQEPVFTEATDLLDRLVLTEGREVQAVIVEIARNLCINHPSARNSQDGENLSEDIDQLFELTRIIVLVLAGLIPNLGESYTQVAGPKLDDEAISLIQLSLSSLVDAAEVFPTIIKADLYACIFHIFSVILGTAPCQAEVCPQALPILRRFVTGIVNNSGDDPTVLTQIRACFKQFLVIFANAQKRETEASLPCVKNTLLASTIMLSSATPLLPPSDPLIIKLLDEMIDCLDDRMTATVACNCIRSLLLLSPNPTVHSISTYLLPRALSYVTSPETIPDASDPEAAPSIARPLLFHALTTFAGSVPESKRDAALAILIPTLIKRAEDEGQASYRETAARLLELAGSDQAGFRTTVASLNEKQRALLEEILREGAVGRNREDAARREGGGERGPSIALKMDFGSTT